MTNLDNIIVVRKPFNIDRSNYGNVRNSATSYGPNFRQQSYGQYDSIPENIITINVKTDTKYVGVDEPNKIIPIDFNFRGVPNIIIWYKINDESFKQLIIDNIPIYVLNPTDTPYLLNLDDIKGDHIYEDDDIIQIKFSDLESTTYSKTLIVEITDTWLSIDTEGGEFDATETSEITLNYNWSDISELIYVDYKINDNEWINVFDEIEIVDPSKGPDVYGFNLSSLDLNHNDTITIRFRDSVDGDINNIINFTIILTTIEIDDIDILWLEQSFEDDEDYFYG